MANKISFQIRQRRVHGSLLGACIFLIVMSPALAQATGGNRAFVCSVAATPRITANPSVSLVNGVIQGNLNANHTNGADLVYEMVSNEVGAKVDLGTVPISGSETDPESFTVLPYATWLDGGAKGTQTFSVRISESPDNTVCSSAPTAKPRTFQMAVNVAALAPADTPLAMTYNVQSFDGSLLSTNFFPATGLAAGETAAVVLVAPDLGERGISNPHAEDVGVAYVPGPGALTAAGFNAITWDARGSFGSGGVSQLGNVFYEGRDVSNLISWAAATLPVQLNGPSDPSVGMVGKSYGASLQLVAASTDPRIDGIVPTSAFFSLDSALHPNNIFRKALGAKLISTIQTHGVHVNGLIMQALRDGVEGERLPQQLRALLAGSGPSVLLQQLQAPTLLLQSSSDPSSRLTESNFIAEKIMDNPFGTPTKMRWFDGADTDNSLMVDQLLDDTFVWLEQYVEGTGTVADLIPSFNWWDQNGVDHTSSTLPFQTGFLNPTPISATSSGGLLVISPMVDGALTATSIRVPVSVRAGKKIAGTPSLSFTYQGRGTSRAVYARIIDRSTGQILSKFSTPIPVVLDGRSHTVSVGLGEIVFTANPSSRSHLVLQIRSSAGAFAKGASGSVAISNINFSIPVVS